MSKNSYNSDKGNSEKVKEVKVAVVIPAKNEEPRIGKTLESFLNQDLKPYRIIVVDDGSSDKTGEISSNYKGVEVVTRPFRKENLVAKKELAETFNAGLQKLSNDRCDFILISGADLIIPKNYISTIVTRMIENPKIAVSSGIVKGEYSNVPRGPGRIVRYDLWKKLGLIYPINYGFEGYLLMKFESLGFENTVYNDMIATTQRKTGSEYHPTRYYYYGLGLKALGYTTLYAIGKILLFSRKKPKGAYYMLKGYLSNYNELYETDLRNYVRKKQIRNILHFKLDYIKRVFTG